MSLYSKRIMIELRPEEYESLCFLAANQRRTPQHQAAIYIEEAVAREAKDNQYVGHQLPFDTLTGRAPHETPQIDRGHAPYAHATETGNAIELEPRPEEPQREIEAGMRAIWEAGGRAATAMAQEAARKRPGSRRTAMDANNEDQDHGEYERRRSLIFDLAHAAAPAARVNEPIPVSNRGASLREELAKHGTVIETDSGDLELRSAGRLWPWRWR